MTCQMNYLCLTWPKSSSDGTDGDHDLRRLQVALQPHCGNSLRPCDGAAH